MRPQIPNCTFYLLLLLSSRREKVLDSSASSGMLSDVDNHEKTRIDAQIDAVSPIKKYQQGQEKTAFVAYK